MEEIKVGDLVTSFGRCHVYRVVGYRAGLYDCKLIASTLVCCEPEELRLRPRASIALLTPQRFFAFIDKGPRFHFYGALHGTSATG